MKARGMTLRASLGLRAIAVLPVATLPATLVAQDSISDTSVVRTSASAQRSVRPNRATFTIQFTAEGTTPQEAGQRLAARADSIRTRLGQLGIHRDSLTTGSGWYWWPERIQITTKPRYIGNGKGGFQHAVDTIPMHNGWEARPKLDTTYRAREIIEVRMSDPSKVGPAIDMLLAMRITEMSRPTFSATDVREARLEALREATARAKDQAEAIAAASGGRLGRVLWLSTDPPDATYRDRYSFDLMSVSGDAAQTGGTQVTAPSVVVTVTVYGRWQLVGR